MGILLGVMRERGRSQKGERLYDVKLFYRGSRVSVVGAITQQSVLAIKVLEKSMNAVEFIDFLKHDLVPNLWKGAGVVMDNLRAHKVEGVKEILEAAGAKVIYTSPYSPEFNSIEHLWWTLKSFLRQFVPQTPKSWNSCSRSLSCYVLVQNYETILLTAVAVPKRYSTF
jgi:transposase